MSNGASTELTGPRTLEALFRAVNTAFIYDPLDLARSAIARRGRSFEGVVAYAFHAQYPDEVKRGHVTASYLDIETDVRTAEFLTVVLAMLAVAQEAGRGGLGGTIDRLRLHMAIRLMAVPWTLLFPFRPQIRYTVTKPSAAPPPGERVAEILSDGRHGRVMASERTLAMSLAHSCAEPISVVPAGVVPVRDAANRIGDPVRVALRPFSPEALEHIATNVLPHEGLAAASIRPARMGMGYRAG